MSLKRNTNVPTKLESSGLFGAGQLTRCGVIVFPPTETGVWLVVRQLWYGNPMNEIITLA